ncbi:MAG TPA: glucosamine-6-phosphate deaminase [Candidatus Limadaptatus stercoripullorum]|uniref:Glucosamine-6-phosphate deaminase n=1 Tax=Candidatus Limadaptatus stercoripullorum TaxID=2840846 RepID=A0A9D1SWZ5_9FIRM|nr:glucosamine-6-phosphate deaminase [Candidatus Limadaptatus stercoripullorum]
MRFAIVKSAAELGERAFYEIKRVLDAKPDAVIGFATGRTPLPLYEKMAEDHKKNGTSYKRVTAINLDEYVGIEAKNKNSFARFMRDNLFSKIDIDPANTNIPNGMAEDLEAECARYAAFVKEHPADIQILGIGGNGHIAFNEPYTKYDTVTHIATLTSRTRSDNAEGFGNPALVPGYALTMGIAEILSAKKILMLASGEGKAEAIYNMLQGRDDTSCPAAALRKHPDVTVVLDEAAAKYLEFDKWAAMNAESGAVEEDAAEEEAEEVLAAEEEPAEAEEQPAEQAAPESEASEEETPEQTVEDAAEEAPVEEIEDAPEEREYLEAEIIEDDDTPAGEPVPEEREYLESEIVEDDEEELVDLGAGGATGEKERGKKKRDKKKRR